MKKISIILASLLVSSCLIIACSTNHNSFTGNGSGGGTSASNPLTIGMHTGPSGPESGLQVHSNTNVAMLPGPLRFLASYIQAQPELATTGSTISMSFTGFCPYTGTGAPGTEFLVYGLGAFGSTCNGGPLDIAPAQQYVGSPVVGNGTISTLVVYSSTVSSSDTGLIVKVYDNNNATTLTCTIKTGQNKCEDLVDTEAVNDGDYLTATYAYDATEAAANGMRNIRVMLGKQ